MVVERRKSLQETYAPRSICFGCGPPTVTAEFNVRFLKPTPIGVVLHVSARVVGMEGRKVTVESELSSGGTNSATFRGTFVAVGEGHPAYGRWMK